MQSRLTGLLVVSLVLGVSIGFSAAPQEEGKQEEKKQEQEQAMTVPDEFPAIDNMHHFMEYIAQPAYKNLKEAIAEEPASRREWKQIKSYALTLAETSALVADRVPEDATEEQIKEWRKYAWNVRETGRLVYRSTRDYAKARENYELMIDNCNQCHTVFADGQYQLDK